MLVCPPPPAFAQNISVHLVSEQPPLTDAQRQLNLTSFEQVWTTIRDKHWESRPGGLDWEAIHTEYRPQIEKADTMDAARHVMREMIGRLKQTHFAILPWSVYQSVETSGNTGGSGYPGFSTRILDSKAIVIDGPSAGSEVVSANGYDIRLLALSLAQETALQSLERERAVESKLSGPVSATRQFVFEDIHGKRSTQEITLQEPPGALATFGNIPAQHVVFETKRIGNVGYIRLTLFLDLVRVLDEYGKFVAA